MRKKAKCKCGKMTEIYIQYWAEFEVINMILRHTCWQSALRLRLSTVLCIANAL